MVSQISLKKELVSLFGHLQKIRRELAVFSPGGDNPDHFATMAEQLDAIIDATESATNDIMEQCEGIEAVMEESRSQPPTPEMTESCNKVSDRVNRIFEACAFQDITGQRVTKVINTLKFIEERINAVILAWGEDELLKVVEEMKQDMSDTTDPDKALLNGPQLKGKGVDQAEVDRLLAQAEIDKLFG
jgi:chemotaxis protein CheZ